MAAITHCLLRSILRTRMILRPPIYKSSFFRFFTGDKPDGNLEIDPDVYSPYDSDSEDQRDIKFFKHIMKHLRRDTKAEFEKKVNPHVVIAKIGGTEDTHMENEASVVITEDELYLKVKVPLHPISMELDIPKNCFIVRGRQDPNAFYEFVDKNIGVSDAYAEFVVQNIGVSDAYAANWSKIKVEPDGTFHLRIPKLHKAREMEANDEEMKSRTAYINNLKQHYVERVKLLAEKMKNLRAVYERSYIEKEGTLERFEDDDFVKLFVRLPLMSSIVVRLNKENDSLTIKGTDPHANKDITLIFESIGLSMLDVSKAGTIILYQQRLVIVIFPKGEKEVGE